MEASEAKWVNPILNIMVVNSLRHRGFHILLPKRHKKNKATNLRSFIVNNLYSILSCVNFVPEKWIKEHFQRKLCKDWINIGWYKAYIEVYNYTTYISLVYAINHLSIDITSLILYFYLCFYTFPFIIEKQGTIIQSYCYFDQFKLLSIFIRFYQYSRLLGILLKRKRQI